MTPTQEQLLISLTESQEFQELIDALREPEIERERKHVAASLTEGNLARACLAQGALQVWELELWAVFKRTHKKILDRQQKGTERARA